MELQSFAAYSHTFQTAAVGALIFAACVLMSQINFYARFRKLPAFAGNGAGDNGKQRTNFLTSGKQMYLDGYKHFKDSVYRMAGTDSLDTIVVPPRFIPELRKLPDSVLSLPRSIDDFFEVKYTKVTTDAPIAYQTIKADLTPALARLNPLICAEVDEAMQDELPACDDWTGVPIYMTLVNIVAKVSGRVFVGPELCKDKDYLDAGINYTMDLITAQRNVKLIRPMLRPFLAPRMAEVRRLRKREEDAKDFLEPIVQARLEAQKKPGYQKPDDMLQWFMNRSGDKPDARYLAKLQLIIIFAAIHTTTMTATNVLYTLASTPEYIQPLRDEIRSVMKENGGVITSRALQQMVKLDSYMKEVMRFYPPGFTSFSRKVLQGFTLSNGQYIPQGTTIEVPSYAVYQDNANFPNADKFDGFRSAKLREGGGAIDHARNQFVTTNEQNLGWGYGQHACPGRFFAANEIKMILARAILDYDIKNEGDLKERYPNIEQGKSSMPDPTKLLMFKKVKA